MRKLISILLICIMALSALPVMAEEAATTEEVVHLLPEPVISDKKVTVLINGIEPTSWVNALYINDILFVPAIAFSKLTDIDSNLIDFYGAAATVLTKDDNTAYLFNDTHYAIINTIGQNLPYACYNVNGILYVSLETVSTLFEIEYTLTEEDETTTLDIIYNTNPNAKAYEEDINSRKVKSDTDYLIWVSKANYSVRLFTKKTDGTWRFKEEYPCAIGKTYSPTCEGTFKYYQKVERWPYDHYYVGPVMRFNGGYALHSTLIRYNGEPYDDRVEAKISAGCVRLHPQDIQYLWDNIPLYTTVYVTGE